MLTNHGELIQWMKAHVQPGDILEIGTFKGDGAAQLARGFPDRQVYTIDILDIESDQTAINESVTLSQMYSDELRGADQWKAIEQTIGGLPNVHFIQGDSRIVDIPSSEIWFTLIDGSHDPGTIISDFRRVWNRSHYVAFHDYGDNLSRVTKTVDHLAGTTGVKARAISMYMVFEHDN